MIKKIFLLLVVIFLFVTLPRTVYGACALNLADVTRENFDTCARGQQGGTAYILYQPTTDSARRLNDIVSLNNQLIANSTGGVNLAIRLYVPGRPPSEGEIASTIATLGSIRSATKYTLTVWNEPNNYHRESQGISDLGQLANEVVDRQEFAYNAIRAAGLTRSINLGSPVLDVWAADNPSTGQFSAITLMAEMNKVAAARGHNDFFKLMDIFLVNFYTNPNNPGVIGNSNYKEVFRSMGVPFDMKWAAPESGIILDRVIYNEETFKTLYQELAKVWGADGNFSWFSLFTRNPDNPSDPYNLLNNPELLRILRSIKPDGNIFEYSQLVDGALFTAWLEEMKTLGLLFECPGGGYSPDETYCNVAPGTRVLASCTAPTRAEAVGQSRPFACDTCYSQIPNPAAACSTSFTAKEVIRYSPGVGNACSGQIYTTETWGGSIAININNAEIPFVGISDSKGLSQPEKIQNYLAEYFEGTLYGPGYKYEDYDNLDDRRIIEEAGVFRKLAPKDIQDNLKKEMIRRAVASKNNPPSTVDPVRDYTITLNRDTELISVPEFFGLNSLSEILETPSEAIFDFLRGIFKTDTVKLADLESAMPPSPQDPDYNNKYRQWKCSSFNPLGIENLIGPIRLVNDLCLIQTREAALWKAVPMFSREDTPGKITLVPQSPGATVTVSNPEALQLEVPHVQRLYEITSEVQSLLFSKSNGGGRFTQEIDSSSIASKNPNSSSPLPLLAANVLQAATSGNLQIGGAASANLIGSDQFKIDYSFSVSESDPEGGCHLNVIKVNGAETGQYNAVVDEVTTGPLQITYNLPEIILGKNQGASANLEIRTDDCGPVSNYSHTCNFTINSSGQLITNCGGTVGPVCGQPPLGSVNVCNVPADPGIGGDKLCCGNNENNQLRANLSVNEVVANPPLTEEEIRNGVTTRAKAVERGVGISLTLPQLNAIWQQTIRGTQGIFKIFQVNAEFGNMVSADVPGESNPITYSFSPRGICQQRSILGFESILGVNLGQACSGGGGNTATPTSGTIKYPHLGAINQVKNLVARTINPKGIAYAQSTTSGFTDQDIDSAIASAASMYQVPPELLRAIFEIEGLDFIVRPSSWECKKNPFTALGLAQVTDGTYATVTHPSERIDNDEGFYSHQDGKLSRCNTSDAFALMARVLLVKVGRLQSVPTEPYFAPRDGGIQLSEKDVIYRATTGYYGSAQPDALTLQYSYNLPMQKRADGMGYPDIVCNKLRQCPPYPPR